MQNRNNRLPSCQEKIQLLTVIHFQDSCLFDYKDQYPF